MSTVDRVSRTEQRVTGLRILRAGAAVAAARASSLVFAAIQLPLLTRLVPQDAYAQFPLAVSLAGYLGLVAADPIILAFQRFPGTSAVSRAYARARRASAVGLLSAAVCAAAVGLGTGHAAMAFAVTGWAVGLAVNRLTATAWLMWGDDWRYTVNLTASTGARTAALLGFAGAGLPLAPSIGLAGLISAAVAIALAPRGRLCSGRHGLAAGTVDWSYRFGAGLAVAQLASSILSTGTVVIVTTVLGTATTAAFTTMAQVAVIASAVMNLITTATYPRIRAHWDAGRPEEATAIIATAGYAFIGIGALAAAALSVGDAWILRRVLPAEFVLAPVVGSLMVSTALASFAVGLGWSHQLELRARTVAIRTGIATAAGVASTVALTVAAGTTGAAAGALVGLVIEIALLAPGTTWFRPAHVVLLTPLVGLALLSPTMSLPSALSSGLFLANAAAAALFIRRNDHDLVSA